MNSFSKPLIISILSCLLLFSCNKESKKNKYVLDSMVQGSYYHIVFYSTPSQYEIISKGIKDIFNKIDNSVSLWVDSSIINKVNRNEEVVLDSIFIDCFNKSQEISELTDGYLDCSIGGLVEVYGFLKKERKAINKKEIDSLLRYVGYKNIRIENGRLVKKYPQTKIDFNAIAQGYTTDKLSLYFLSLGVKDFIIDVGGEVRANGVKEDGKKWLCAIEEPSTNSDSPRNFNKGVELSNNAIVTSGNYRKYYIDEKGERKSHTIDPFTGLSVTHSLLSVSVISENATLSDGLATAFMVMGLEKSKIFLQSYPNLKAYFIYWDNGVYKSYATKNLNVLSL